MSTANTVYISAAFRSSVNASGSITGIKWLTAYGSDIFGVQPARIVANVFLIAAGKTDLQSEAKAAADCWLSGSGDTQINGSAKIGVDCYLKLSGTESLEAVSNSTAVCWLKAAGFDYAIDDKYI